MTESEREAVSKLNAKVITYAQQFETIKERLEDARENLLLQAATVEDRMGLERGELFTKDVNLDTGEVKDRAAPEAVTDDA